MSRVHPPRLLASAAHAPPGCLIRDLASVEEIDPDYGPFTVRLPDGSGWHANNDVDGMGPICKGDGDGWRWDLSPTEACEVLEENLTHDECLAILSTPRNVLEARYTTPPPVVAPVARPWVIGVGVFVTHTADGGYPRVLYSQRRAGASDGVGAWSCPGGRLDATDVDIVACARRETLEETGLKLAGVRVLPGHKLGRRPDGVPYLTVFVHATVDARHIPPFEEDTNGWPVAREMEPEKHHPWRWLTDGDLTELEGDVWDRDLARAVLRDCELAREQLTPPQRAPHKSRYVTATFFGDDVIDRWYAFNTIAEAQAASRAIGEFAEWVTYVYDLELDALMHAADEVECNAAEAAHREAALASAREALADLRAAYVGKVAPL